MKIKIKEHELNSLPFKMPKENEFDFIQTIGNNLLLSDKEGNLYEVFPRKCQIIKEEKYADIK